MSESFKDVLNSKPKPYYVYLENKINKEINGLKLNQDQKDNLFKFSRSISPNNSISPRSKVSFHENNMHT